MGPRALAALLAPVPAYFCFRIASGLLLLKLSASFLSVDDFATFMQFLLFASLLNMVAVGGTQNGLIRQAAAASDAAMASRLGQRIRRGGPDRATSTSPSAAIRSTCRQPWRSRR